MIPRPDLLKLICFFSPLLTTAQITTVIDFDSESFGDYVPYGSDIYTSGNYVLKSNAGQWYVDDNTGESSSNTLVLHTTSSLWGVFDIFLTDSTEFNLESFYYSPKDAASLISVKAYDNFSVVNPLADTSIIAPSTQVITFDDSFNGVRNVRVEVLRNPAFEPGDRFDSFVLSVNETPLSVSITAQSNVSCNGGSNGSLTATTTDGTANFNYSWSNGSTAANTSSTTDMISGLAAGTYTVTVTDNNGSTAIDSATVTEPTVLNPGIILTN